MKFLRFKRNFPSVMVLIALAMIPSISFANYECRGTVNNVSTDQGSNVLASFIFSTGSMPFMYVCNLNQVSNGISAEGCKGMLSILLTAQATQRTVGLWFNNTTPNNCSYSAGWVSLTSLGWYFGPSLYN
ncbi:MAG: hypothetical protein ABUS47_02845 [Steroidobacter sp.]